MTTVKIKGMSCQHCVASVTQALESLPGIQEVTVDLASGKALIEGETNEQAIRSAITRIGFEVASFSVP